MNGEITIESTYFLFSQFFKGREMFLAEMHALHYFKNFVNPFRLVLLKR